MNARAKKIRAAVTAGSVGVLLKGDLDALAEMIEFATSPASKKTKPDFADKLPVSPAAFIEQFKEGCGDFVLCDPILGSWYGRLGGVLKNFDPKFQQEDLELLIQWVQSGGLSWWTGKPTFEHLMIHLPKWLGYAREWRKKNGTSTEDLWGAFKGA